FGIDLVEASGDLVQVGQRPVHEPGLHRLGTQELLAGLGDVDWRHVSKPGQLARHLGQLPVDGEVALPYRHATSDARWTGSAVLARATPNSASRISSTSSVH